MLITVRFFASYADALGQNQIELDVSSDATVRDVIQRVREMGDADRLPAAPVVAVNEQYASRDQLLRHGDEVALIPPVAGG